MVDVAAVTAEQGALRALVVPSDGSFGLPGDSLGARESLDSAAERVLGDAVGLRGVFLEQLYTFGDVERDPRHRAVSVAYYALVDKTRLGDRPLARLEVPWEGETGGPVVARGPGGAELELALDHAGILGMAVKRLRGKLDYAPIGYQLLPERFTLRELQDVHETVLGRPLNKDSFRRRMLASGELEATGEHEGRVGHRPAELYRFQRRSAV